MIVATMSGSCGTEALSKSTLNDIGLFLPTTWSLISKVYFSLKSSRSVLYIEQNQLYSPSQHHIKNTCTYEEKKLILNEQILNISNN